MVRADVAWLIAEDPKAHGVFDPTSPQKRMVYVVVKSVGQTEMYAAMSQGLKPTFILELSDYSEYHGEKLVEYGGRKYRIIRTYVKDMTLEMTLEES